MRSVHVNKCKPASPRSMLSLEDVSKYCTYTQADSDLKLFSVCHVEVLGVGKCRCML